ncbi:hypothetical protein [Sphingopyxis bauzanensis]|uniref:hypothetical protein n=1 Tax=Sphingopyxis bauzanensis TaxID=651663 RepID=UPI001E4AB91C|nr:hypothetical protein [Sphingopyxis bauzanensis]
MSTYPIEIATARDGTMHAEVSIFRNFAPWVGLQLSGQLASVEPATVDAQGERHPWLPVLDKHGAVWWIPATSWSKPNSRYLSEMHRSFGTFSVELGPYRSLVIDAVANELDRAHAQEYLDDFRDELVWLAIGKPTGALGEVGSDYSRDLVDALGEFAQAAGRVLEHPAQEIREVTALAPPSRLRPNAETFRSVMRRPGARLYPGRAAQESADVPENRYLRGLVQHCRRVAQSLARSSSRHHGHLAARSAREKARAADLLVTEQIEVDQEIFDNQLADIRRRMDAIANWAVGSVLSRSNEREYRFSVGKKYEGKGGGLFYRNLDGDSQNGGGERFQFSVAQLPEGLHELVREAQSIDKDLTLALMGKASVSSFTTAKGTEGRRATFTKVSAVRPRSPVLERRVATRLQYEREGWHRAISTKERQEYRAEANTALIRASQFDVRAQEGAMASAALDAIGSALGRQEASWDRLRVSASSTFPMGMRFVQNPIYAGALAAFHKVVILEQSTGIGGDTLEKLGRINILHASALYERWCLIKIVAVLIEDFGFVPQPDWVEHVVTFSAQASEPRDPGFTIKFTRQYPSLTAQLDVEPVLANGRRPDFRLRFKVAASASDVEANVDLTWGYRPSILGNLAEQHSGLVMDAKFRTRWKQGGLADMLRLLVDAKDYGQDGDRVFILHPAKGAVEHRTSPLVWSRDCDYGQDHPTGHAHGSIQLGADPVSAGASTMNLRRLIALELQEVFPKPEFVQINANGAGQSGREDKKAEICRSNASLCIACGKAHGSIDVTQGKTERGNAKWFYRCSDCGTASMRTPCFGCGTELHKNGLHMTYHLTIADHVANVVCPDCGANF